MKRRRSEAVSSQRGWKMMLRVNSKAKMLANASSVRVKMKMRVVKTMVNAVDKSVDVEKPSFPRGAYDI